MNEVDKNVRAYIGNLIIEVIAAQTKVDELTAKVAELEAKLLAESPSK